jgi:hypothetical protein
MEKSLTRLTGIQLLSATACALLTLSSLSISRAATARAAIEIDTCGIEVGPGQEAHLVRDLDCSESNSEGIVLADGAVLYLAGHRILGGPTDRSSAWQGVRCRAGSVCSVVGPGAIDGFSASGVAGTRVRLRDLAITGNGRAGVVAFENIRLRNVFVDGNAAGGVRAGGRARISRSSVSEGVVELRRPPIKPNRSNCVE